MTAANPTPEQLAELSALVALARHEQHAGRLAEAAEAYRKIIALRPDIAEAHNDLGIVLAQQGKSDEAVPRFEQALALRPDYADARNNLGNVLLGQGRLDEATAHYEQALILRPDFAGAHNALGRILWTQGKLDEAAAHYRQAIALRPDYAEALNNLGAVLLKQDKLDEAAARYEQALALRPNYAEALCNLGALLKRQGKFDQAVARLEQALALRPDYAEAHNNLGNVLLAQGKFNEAAARYQQVLVLQPADADAHNNLGILLAQQGRLDEAAARYQHALALRPDYAEAYNNLGTLRFEQDQLDEAATNYRQALTLAPGYAEAQFGLAMCYLSRGDYEHGWPAYEARLRMPGHVPLPNLPRWTGEPLAGRSLLLLAEQGLGDAFQFIRYARLLRERGARVVLATQPALGRLLAPDPALDALYILGSGEELPRADFYLPLLSAPRAFGTTAATIPGEVPYLWADAKLTERWRAELAGIDGFKIGIAWQGARDYRFDRRRSVPLAEFAPLARLPGVRLISLQKGFGSEQVGAVDFPLLDFSDRLDQAAGAFMDTAAAIRNLDLVITADTAIGHLTGALGMPVWLALQLSADWRWLRGREDSPWYPTARLFRQTALGEWSDVFERMADAVQTHRASQIGRQP